MRAKTFIDLYKKSSMVKFLNITEIYMYNLSIYSVYFRKYDICNYMSVLLKIGPNFYKVTSVIHGYIETPLFNASLFYCILLLLSLLGDEQP